MIALAALIAAQAPSFAPLPLGEQVMLTSLEARREVNVVLPLSYGTDPARRYPVVYMLDGGVAQDLMMQVGTARWTQMWGQSADFILVGIETKDRQRELISKSRVVEEQKKFPTAGESAAFRAWIGKSVMPMIDARYRTDGRDFLVGESAAGYFVVETAVEAPRMFEGYGAINPSLWWNRQGLVERALARSVGKAPMFVSIANEGDAMDGGVRKVVAQRKAAGAATCFADRPDLTHANAYQALLPAALQYLLPADKPTPPEWGMVTGCAK